MNDVPIPLISRYRRPAPLIVRGSVALVGSSDLLGETDLGTEIDSYDTVFRFNLASLEEKYRQQVGAKTGCFFFSQNITTHRYPHPPDLQKRFKDYCLNYPIICYPGHEINILRYNPRPYLLGVNIDIVNQILQHLLPNNSYLFSSRHHPRNGIKLLACLLTAGIRPTLFGFDIKDRGINSHYYDNETQAETPERGHKPSVEFQLLSALAEKGLVTIR